MKISIFVRYQNFFSYYFHASEDPPAPAPASPPAPAPASPPAPAPVSPPAPASPPAPPSLLLLLLSGAPPSAGGCITASGCGLAAPAPAASYYEANIAYCMAVSSSSAPASKRKLAAYSIFLSQARYASAALCFGNP